MEAGGRFGELQTSDATSDHYLTYIGKRSNTTDGDVVRVNTDTPTGRWGQFVLPFNSFSWNPQSGSSQSVQQHPNAGKSIRTLLGEFLAANPNCLTALQKADDRLDFGSYKDLVDSVPIIDGRDPATNKELIDPNDPSKGTYHDRVLRQLEGGGLPDYGTTTYKTGFPTIYISAFGATQFKNLNTRASERDFTSAGEVIFHETLHAYFWSKGLNSHEDIVKVLGIELADAKYKNGTLKSEDTRFVDSITAWLANGCRNIPKKGKKKK